MSIRYPVSFFLSSALLAFALVEAAPNDLSALESGERPQPTHAGPVPTMATFGLCTGPQNALDFPSSPVPVTEDRCNFRQRFSATSVAPSNAPGSCGGYSVAFGAMGDLKRDMKTVRLTAEWGDAPIASANACASAQLAAVAWGYRCDNDGCTQGGWEKIELQRQPELHPAPRVRRCRQPLQDPQPRRHHVADGQRQPDQEARQGHDRSRARQRPVLQRQRRQHRRSERHRTARRRRDPQRQRQRRARGSAMSAPGRSQALIPECKARRVVQ